MCVCTCMFVCVRVFVCFLRICVCEIMVAKVDVSVHMSTYGNGA